MFPKIVALHVDLRSSSCRIGDCLFWRSFWRRQHFHPCLDFIWRLHRSLSQNDSLIVGDLLPAQLARKGAAQRGSEAPCQSFRDLVTKVSKSSTCIAYALLSEPLTPRGYLIPFLSFLLVSYYRLDGLRLDNKVTIQWEHPTAPTRSSIFRPYLH